MSTIDIAHHTCCRYGAPVEVAQHLAYLRPLDSARQRVLSFDLRVDPEPSHRALDTDVFGNWRHVFSVGTAHTRLDVRAASRVQVNALSLALTPAQTPPWEPVAERLRHRPGQPYHPACEFAQPSPYVPRLAALRALGDEVFTAGRPLADAAIALMHQIHADFRYDSASTAVDTPLAQVLAHRSGVCQDFAHVMIGALRARGLAARYVSGYLLATPPTPGAAPLLGAQASHAWVAVWVPGLHGGHDGDWLELDPTNAVCPALGHVRLAIGRDYGDVTPLRGVIRGGGAHSLEVTVTTSPAQGLLVPNR